MFVTLPEYSASSWKESEQYDGLEAVVAGIAEGAQQIQAKVRAAVLAHAVGVTGETNVQGEVVQILDTFSSETLVNTLSQCGRVAAIGSEEIEETVIVGDSPAHQYLGANGSAGWVLEYRCGGKCWLDFGHLETSGR